jgi:hypothetical protein
MPAVAVVNQSTILDDETAAKIASALEQQANEDICPAWGLAPVTVAVKAPGPADWQLIFLDDTDQDEALGYHKGSETGLPVMEVFVHACRQAGVSESACASHELAEALADPYLTTASFDGGSKFWAVEIGDAAQSSNYEVDGIEMQDFVTPAWFDSTPPIGAKFDHTGAITKPFEVPEDGYSQFLDLNDSSKGWQVVGRELGAGDMRQKIRGGQLEKSGLNSPAAT